MTRDEAKKFLPLIQVYAEGQTIQFKSRQDDKWYDTEQPCWLPEIEYRAKPILRMYRVALYNYPNLENRLILVQDKLTADWVETNQPNFQKWVTDWIEVEV